MEQEIGTALSESGRLWMHDKNTLFLREDGLLVARFEGCSFGVGGEGLVGKLQIFDVGSSDVEKSEDRLVAGLAE